MNIIKNNKVKAIILGAARSGSTTLASYLASHPNIDFSKEKEVHFFSFDDINLKGESYLDSFFSNNNNYKITADTYLLVDKKGPERILKYNPNIKFILILRDPVLRAFSGYNYSVRNGYINEKLSFIDACQNETEYLNSEDIVLKNNICNILRSKYFYNLEYWQTFFPKENFLLLKTTELKENPNFVLTKIANFLGIEDKTLQIEEKVKNKAFSVRSKTLQQLLVNRNNPFRQFLKKILPPFVNKILIKSGIVVKIANMNRQTEEYKEITKEEYKFAYKLLEEDILALKAKYEIDFSKNEA